MAENILLCGKIMILSVYSIHYFPLIHIGEVYFFSNNVPRYGKNNLSNDQEVAQPKPNPVLKAEIMK